MQDRLSVYVFMYISNILVRRVIFDINISMHMKTRCRPNGTYVILLARRAVLWTTIDDDKTSGFK